MRRFVCVDQGKALRVSERSLRSYLLLPRPGDLVKAWIFPAAFALGVLAADGVSGTDVLRATLIWLALELLIYQARYQWNDIRGFEADQRHPDRVARGRLPGPLSRGKEHIRASALVAAARLGLAAALALALSSLDLTAPLLALTVAVFGVAILYELLRERATGRDDRVPPALTPAILALWAVVGAGYAIRGVSGLAAAVDVFDDPGLLAAAVLTFWSFGIAFVTGRWALEALPFGRQDGGGGIEWRVEPGQAREHTLALVRWLPTRGPGPAERRAEGSLGGWRALTERASLSAPWNLAAIVAATAAAVAGRLLAGSADVFEVALAACAGAACAAAVLALPGRRWPGLLAGSAALALLIALAGSPRPLLAVLPWLCIFGAHLFFASQSPETLAHPLRSAFA
jgi:hypothetical protein